MSNSIFETFSVDRRQVKWEDYLRKMTPWENRGGIWFKREDYFAPLGYGGPNGSKMRQLIHLFKNHRGNATHVLTGASILSPQHSMTAIVASHYDMPTRHVIGSPSPLSHVNTRVAAGFGASFEKLLVGYNPALQREVERLTRPDTFVVPYGITVDHKVRAPEDVYDFHDVGANQVRNTPEDVEVLIAPAGSCNSLTSIIKGLCENKTNVKKLFSIGIGPNKIDWVKERLDVMGIDPNNLPFKWINNVSLHESGFASYGDKMKESFAGIDFHPTYEGKMIRWLKQNNFLDDPHKLGFWIVGSEPKIDVIQPYFTHNPETGEAYA